MGEKSFELSDMLIRLKRKGALRRQKLSFPVHYGLYHQLDTPRFTFKYNLRGEIVYIQGKDRDWPHPGEWLKRTQGGHWIYYYSGGYTDIEDYTGEFYLPCPSYTTNILYNIQPFQDPAVQEALQAWPTLPDHLSNTLNGQNDPDLWELYTLLQQNSVPGLDRKARQLFDLLQDRISVLPPDARHTDYDLLPLILADGCLYNCGFCRVKSGHYFQPRSKEQIKDQIRGLSKWYGPDLVNHNALFLGQHDALNCDPELIFFALDQGAQGLQLQESVLQDRYLYLFGSVHSLLHASEELFQELESGPWKTYINIGLESADQRTLDELRKPLKAWEVQQAFTRMQELNEKYTNVELSGNIILDRNLPEKHWQELSSLVHKNNVAQGYKGCIYLSPLGKQDIRWQREQFRKLKFQSALPMYLYVILSI